MWFTTRSVIAACARPRRVPAPLPWRPVGAFDTGARTRSVNVRALARNMAVRTGPVVGGIRNPPTASRPQAPRSRSQYRPQPTYEEAASSAATDRQFDGTAHRHGEPDAATPRARQPAGQRRPPTWRARGRDRQARGDDDGDINASSRRIADIIGVVDSIAIQTNILALNAAVEAARAGDQGPAFAWWPPRCAPRPTQRAGRHRDQALIAANRRQVSTAAAASSPRPARPWAHRRRGAARDDLVGEITGRGAGAEQRIARWNQAVAQLDQMTQQNAAGGTGRGSGGQPERAGDPARQALSVFRLDPVAA